MKLCTVTLLLASSVFCSGQEQRGTQLPFPLSLMLGEACVQTWVYDQGDKLLSYTYSSSDQEYVDRYLRSDTSTTLKILRSDLQTGRLINFTESDGQGRTLNEAFYGAEEARFIQYRYEHCAGPVEILLTGDHSGACELQYNNDCQLTSRCFTSSLDTSCSYFTYDAARLVSETTINAGYLTNKYYRYNPAGELIEERDSIDGNFVQSRSFSHDQNGRVVLEVLQHHNEGLRTITKRYNAVGLVVERIENFYKPYDEVIETFKYSDRGELIGYSETNKWWTWSLEMSGGELQKTAVLQKTHGDSTSLHTGTFSFSSTGKLLQFVYK